MSSFGSQMRKRLEELKKQGRDVPKIMAEVQEGATIAAVEKATRMTPPNGNASLSGTNTRTGDLAQHWELDSQTKPTVGGGTIKTTLANSMQYVSYVNDGHKMDKHFVPGLEINKESGMLEMNPGGKGGIVVGTRTPYVKGLYMKEAGIGAYRTALRNELTKRVEEGFR